MVWVNVAKSKNIHNIPGFPEISNDLWRRTGERLQGRQEQFQPAKDGLTRWHVFGGDAEAFQARTWLFGAGGGSKKIRMKAASIERPRDFMISWTLYENELDPGADDRLADQFAKELTDVEAATRGFWPRIAKFWTGYNLLGILRKVTKDRLHELKILLDGRRDGPPRRLPGPERPTLWQDRFKALQEKGRLFEIDLTTFSPENIMMEKCN